MNKFYLKKQDVEHIQIKLSLLWFIVKITMSTISQIKPLAFSIQLTNPGYHGRRTVPLEEKCLKPYSRALDSTVTRKASILYAIGKRTNGSDISVLEYIFLVTSPSRGKMSASGIRFRACVHRTAGRLGPTNS